MLAVGDWVASEVWLADEAVPVTLVVGDVGK
jgi:hypothetical protein